MVGVASLNRVVMVDFLVVNAEIAYNAILGRRFLQEVQGVVSLPHLMMKFPVEDKVGIVRGNKKVACECYLTSVRAIHMISEIREEAFERQPEDKKEKDTEKRKSEPAEDLRPIQIWENPEEVTYIGKSLAPQEASRLEDLLRENRDLFAFDATEVPRISPDITSHRLNIDPECKPVKQKKRNSAPERQRAIEGEVDKLLRVGLIREVYYPK